MARLKVPRPATWEAHVPDVVGLGSVDQQTPRSVTGAPASATTVPPPVAAFQVTPAGAAVVTVASGGAAEVKVSSSP
jgi:hypothetical protein